MGNLSEMDDHELAYMLYEWRGDALLSWDSFTDDDKRNFRRMQDEACRRFIEANLDDYYKG